MIKIDDAYSGKKIVVVGAGSTGRCLARYFLNRGGKVILSDVRRADSLTGLEDLSAEGVHLDLGGHDENEFLSSNFLMILSTHPKQSDSSMAES